MSVQNGRAFNEWLRAQLKAKKMSQRQLAQQSGVDHIDDLAARPRRSHAFAGHRHQAGPRPARGPRRGGHAALLRPHGLERDSHPTARVEYALRADELLSEPQVRQVMEYYLALRMRRLAVRQPGGATRGPVRRARLAKRN